VTTTQIWVLQVDDDSSFLHVSKNILEAEGPFSVEIAYSVDEALLKLKTSRYDIVISDFEMPMKNGLDFLKLLRESGSDIPFILFTGKGREEIIVQALNLGADRYIDKHGEPKVVYTELSAGIRQLYEKSQATRMLWESEERFKKMVTSSKDMIMLTQSDGIILYVSPASKEIFGYEPEELIGKHPRVIHPQDSERVQKIFQASLTTKVSGKADYRIITKQGQTKWLHHSYSQIIENDKILQVVSIVQDVTETKKAEAELSVSEEKFSAAFNSSGAALALTRVCDGLFVEVNDCLLKLLGYTREEVIGKSIIELKVYANISDREEILAIIGNKQSVINREIKVKKRDNTTATVLYSTKEISIKGQAHLLTTFIDISELKRTEKALFLRQKELENFMSLAPDAVTIIGTDGKVVCCNEIAGKFFGCSPGEVIGRSGADFIVEEDREKLIHSFEEASRENKVKTKSYMARQQNGQEFTAESSIKAIMDETGNTSAYIAITRDITKKIAKENRVIELLEESKRRESNLKDLIVISESILRNCSTETVLERILGSFESIIHSESGLIFLTGSELANDIAISHYKGNTYKRKNGVPKNLPNVCQRICHSNQAVYINDLRDSPFVDLIKKMPFEVPSNGAIIPLRIKQNVAGYIILSNKPGGFNDNDLLIATLLAEFAVIALENNAAMEALANSERQMRAITDSANDAIVMIDIEGKISFWSTAAEIMFGYTFAETRGKDFHLICTPERFHAGYALGFEAFRETGKSFTLKRNLEFIAIRRTGEEFCAELSLSSFKLGTSWNAVGLIRDISERKRQRKN
jgi:PAS domain S-box-containing protein